MRRKGGSMTIKHFRAYLHVWSKLTAQQFQQNIANARGAAILFIFGKLFRFASVFLVVSVIVGRAKQISGYSFGQAIFILAIFNFAGTITQLFLRGVYIFRQKIEDGTFDFYLLNPLNELFYSLFSYTDPIDIIVSIPYLFILVWAWHQTGYPITLMSAVFLFALIIIMFIMVTAWHIFIISIGVRYLEVDNTVMLYRDFEKMAAFPTTMYGKLGDIFLTYITPIGIIATIPANLVFGMTSPWYILVFGFLAFVQLKLALGYWRRSLMSYSSASS